MITELVSTLLESFTLPILIEETTIYILSFVQSLTIHKNSLQDSSSYRSYKHKYSIYLIDTFYPPYLQSYIALIFFIRTLISSNIYIHIQKIFFIKNSPNIYIHITRYSRVAASLLIAAERYSLETFRGVGFSSRARGHRKGKREGSGAVVSGIRGAGAIFSVRFWRRNGGGRRGVSYTAGAPAASLI